MIEQLMVTETGIEVLYYEIVIFTTMHNLWTWREPELIWVYQEI